jgi:hypothetical protein
MKAGKSIVEGCEVIKKAMNNEEYEISIRIMDEIGLTVIIILTRFDGGLR